MREFMLVVAGDDDGERRAEGEGVGGSQKSKY